MLPPRLLDVAGHPADVLGVVGVTQVGGGRRRQTLMGVGPSRWGRGRPFGGNLVSHAVGGAVVVTGSTPSPEGIHFPFDGPSTGVVQAWSLPQLSPAHFCTLGGVQGSTKLNFASLVSL